MSGIIPASGGLVLRFVSGFVLGLSWDSAAIFLRLIRQIYPDFPLSGMVREGCHAAAFMDK
jgi:hypothetical protein